ncbi:response regulator [Nonomuraea terrae]|uniref:response regulator n=1 Tax=Nonomuraea terrae TaxID=2530383 RepID=UPI003793191E
MSRAGDRAGTYAPSTATPAGASGTSDGATSIMNAGISITNAGITMSASRAMAADDQELAGFRLILTARGIDVAGEAVDGAEAVAVAVARRLAPDVVLTDIRTPVMDGLEAACRVPAHDPHCRVIMPTTFDLDRYVYPALSLGASGFLLKDVTPEHLAAAVRLVGTGDALLAPSITRRLVERYAAARRRRLRPGRPDAARARGPHAARPGSVQRRAGRRPAPERVLPSRSHFVERSSLTSRRRVSVDIGGMDSPGDISFTVHGTTQRLTAF